MTQPNLLELAKQGHPKAIAMLLNQQLQNHQITIEVTKKNSCLHICLEAVDIPDQKIYSPLICQEISQLNLKLIERVKIYGKQIAEKSPAWFQEFEIAGQSTSEGNLSKSIKDLFLSKTVDEIQKLKSSTVDKASELKQVVSQSATDATKNLQKTSSEVSQAAAEQVKQWQETAAQMANTQAQNLTKAAAETAKSTQKSLQKKTSEVTQTATNKVNDLKETVSQTAKAQAEKLGEAIKASMPPPRQSRAVRSLAFLNDEKTVICGREDGTIELWDLATDQSIFTLSRTK
jgi:WD40 repeat protein